MASSTTINQFLVDLAERAGTTFLQAFLTALLATGVANTSSAPLLDALLIAVFAALVAVVSTVVVWMGRLKPLTNPYLDLGYRTVLTFLQTLLGYMFAAGAINTLAFDWGHALLASGTAAATALLKALVGLNKRSTVGASLFVPKRPHSPRHRPIAT